MRSSPKYPQPHSLQPYYVSSAPLDKIHNGLKHGAGEQAMKRYQIYLKPIRKGSNGHDTNPFR
jgi:hypothetical protein